MVSTLDNLTIISLVMIEHFKYSVTPQEWVDDQNQIHDGQILTLWHLLGSIGWLDVTQGGGCKTATLINTYEDEGLPINIFTKQFDGGLTVSTILLKLVFRHLHNLHFSELQIPGASSMVIDSVAKLLDDGFLKTSDLISELDTTTQIISLLPIATRSRTPRIDSTVSL